MAWLALTLEVAPEGADALSEALMEAGAQSVGIDGFDRPCRTLSALLPPGCDAAALLREASIAAALPLPSYATREVDDADWVRRTQAQFVPTEIGARLWVGASWHRPPAGRLAVWIDPGLAFGTGTHPTTRLMLAFLERTVRGGEAVLDYGCGSGILAIAAAKLGASTVEAVDIDPQAVDTTASNARNNGVALRAALPGGLPPRDYDLVVANILAQPLIDLAPGLVERLRRGGRLALAGILDSQAHDVAAAYAPWFDMAVESVEDGWVLLAGGRP